MKLLALLTLCLTAYAQQPDNTDALRNQVARQRHILADWAGLTRYGSEDAELKLPTPGENRVVFIGDDATDKWTGAEFFPGQPYINRGIAGQTTPQMLVRFRQDVIQLKPRVVVIQGGMNDLAGVMGPATQGTAAENLMSMVELAKVNGIKVVLASMLPVCDCKGVTQTRVRPVGKLIGMNNWLRDYAAESGSIYLNYYGALVEGRAFRQDLTIDGLVPNEAGYKVMAPVAQQAINQALAKATPR
jgi:lysophospholipase L1-like esterase